VSRMVQSISRPTHHSKAQPMMTGTMMSNCKSASCLYQWVPAALCGRSIAREQFRMSLRDPFLLSQAEGRKQAEPWSAWPSPPRPLHSLCNRVYFAMQS
jgi:hypothetical protein